MHASRTRVLSGCALAVILVGDIGVAHAQDFFSQFFGGFARRIERPMRMPFAPESFDENGSRSQRGEDDSPRSGGGRGQAYCVRTCDGRYFPISAQGEQSKATSCSNFCPSSETRVFYGSAIDMASSNNGKQRYVDLPNAFKYRAELVAGCTCNGKTTMGLAAVKIEDDPTLRRGDIVAGAEGLLVSRGSDRRGASLNFSPASESVRAKYDRPPLVAAE